jgi:hypothetical protein
VRSNGWRLSCGARRECSQRKFYHTVRRTFNGLVGDGRRQLQARVRLHVERTLPLITDLREKRPDKVSQRRARRHNQTQRLKGPAQGLR